jgi:protein O-mannosyl-transferase
LILENLTSTKQFAAIILKSVNSLLQELKQKRAFSLICLALVVGTAALYWPTIHHPFILYDDEQYVTVNHHVTTGLNWANLVWAFTNGEAANWHPLTWLSHQLDCALFGMNADGHHFVNLLFHVANTLLVFVFLRGVTGAVWRSAFVAALFAWHPLHVESVAWVSERKDVLSTFFWMLTLMTYVRFARSMANSGWAVIGGKSATSPVSRHPSLFYFTALFFFTCGLLSKPMVVTLPFVLLLLDFWPLGRMTHGDNGEFQISNFKLLMLEKIPFFIFAAAGSAVTYLVQTNGGAVWQTPLIERLANAVIAYARYVAKTFWPSDLAIVYSHPKHWPVTLALGAALVLAVWTILCIRNWRKEPFLAVGWFWFVGTLVPTIGIVQVGAQSMADRYTYIPSIGFFIVIVWGAADLMATRPRGKIVLALAGGVALIGCALTTSIQISYWRDNITLFRHAIEVSPDNYIAANCLGKAYEKIGDKAHALILYRASVEETPRFPQSQFNYAMILLEFGDTQEGLKHLEAAAALEPRNPDIQYDLGIYFAQHGSWTNAVNCFRNALLVRPDFADAKKLMDQVLAAHPELH